MARVDYTSFGGKWIIVIGKTTNDQMNSNSKFKLIFKSNINREIRNLKLHSTCTGRASDLATTVLRQ